MDGNTLTNPSEFKAYRVDFEYSEKAAIHIAAQNETEASAGALAMLKGKVKDATVIQVTNVTEPEPESENVIFPPTITMN